LVEEGYSGEECVQVTVFQALGKLRKKNPKLESSLVHIERPCQRRRKRKNRRRRKGRRRRTRGGGEGERLTHLH
jgi:hypothetical protein